MTINSTPGDPNANSYVSVEELDKAVKPAFPPGTKIDAESLATDSHGVTWWVDPKARKIDRVA